MKDVWKQFIVFVAWSVIFLAAFSLVMLAVLPGVAITKPPVFIIGLVIIVCAFLVKLFDPAFTKKITSATGK
jgi:Na+-transporting NADH:ubiquinone oxidoreductase subunit NqrB